MRTQDARQELGPRARAPRWARAVALSAALLLAGAPFAGSARADDHDPSESGHPLRVVAYALHPVGVIVDTLIMRPAHWLVHHEPFRTLFGHRD